MNRKVISTVLAVLLLAQVNAVPLYAKEKKIEGKLSGKVMCLVELAADHEYQGSNSVCVDPKHSRVLLTKEGKIYILEPAHEASKDVVKLIKSNVLEKKHIIVNGEVLKKGAINIIKVKSIEVR